MSADWISFGVVIFIQFVFFVLSAQYYKKLSSIPRLLLLGIVLGTAIGLLYDNLLGKYFGLFYYTLGFGTAFLLLNAALSYGLFVASSLLLKEVSTVHFIVWLSSLVGVYEITNYFFPVWSYNFSLPLIPFFILCLAGYSSGALLASVISKFIFKQHFALEIKS